MFRSYSDDDLYAALLALDSLLGGSSVIDVQIESGFESGSGFRAAMVRPHGLPPAAVRRSSPPTLQ